jgi:MEMO1 family protein
MTGWSTPARGVRMAAVAGAFYPADPHRLRTLVSDLLDEAAAGPRVAGPLAGILVSHAGLVYSGSVAATAWRLLAMEGSGAGAGTVVVLGTNHGAAWLDGVGAWPGGAWRTPLGDVEVDADLAAVIVALGPPFVADADVHATEHSIEVQLPILQTVAPDLRIVPLAVSTGIGPDAIAAGQRLGNLIAVRRAAGERIVLAISTDMAHYPDEITCGEVTRRLLPAILSRDALAVARLESATRTAGIPGLVCGMCGVEPAVVGFAALATAGAGSGVALASATSADRSGRSGRTVGYLAVAFPW